jgi:hypothetical protein
MFEALFKGVSTRFGLRIVENSHRKSAFHLLFLLPKSSFGEHAIAQSVFATVAIILLYNNDIMLPNRRFWKEEHKRRNVDFEALFNGVST